jgi:hypothetical protein
VQTLNNTYNRHGAAQPGPVISQLTGTARS